MAREVKTNFTADTSDLVRGAHQAENALDGAESSSRNWGRAGLVAAAGVGAAAAVAWDFAEAAAEDEQAAASLATTLRNTTRATDAQVSSVEDWITATQNSTGVMDDALRPALDRLVRSTGDVGEAQDLLSLAMDISAGTGQDLQTVSQQLALAEDGRVRGLQSLGIATRDASGETLSFDQIVANASETFGGQMAASLDTTTGQLNIARANFESMKEEIGARLLPVMATVAQFIVQDLIPALSAAASWVEENWPKIRDTAEEVWAKFTAFAQAAWDYIGPIVGGIYDVIAGFVGLVKNIFEGDWSDAWDSAVRMVSGAWDAIRGLLTLIGDAVAAMGRAAVEVLTGLATGVVDWFQELGGDIIEAMGRGITAAGGLASDFAADFANAVIRFVNTQLIDRINDAVQFTVDPPGPGSFTFDPPDIPHVPTLDTGGIVTGPTLAALSMNSVPEVVVPLPRLESMLGGGGGGRSSVTIPASGQVDAYTLRLGLEELQRVGALRADVLVAV